MSDTAAHPASAPAARRGCHRVRSARARARASRPGPQAERIEAQAKLRTLQSTARELRDYVRKLEILERVRAEHPDAAISTADVRALPAAARARWAGAPLATSPLPPILARLPSPGRSCASRRSRWPPRTSRG